MNATLERLIALKAEATTTRGQIEYLDQVLTDAVVICRRPGDVERCATFLDELVAEIATTRVHAATRAPSGAERTPSGTGAQPHPYEPSTGTGSHRAQETP